MIINKSEGKTENSKGDFIKTETIKITKAEVRLKDRSKSKKNGGIGITIIMRTEITPKATKNSLDFFKYPIQPWFSILCYPNRGDYCLFPSTKSVKKRDVFDSYLLKQ